MKVLRYTWAVYFFIWFLVIFLLLYPVFLVLLSRKQWYKHAHNLRSYWGKSLMLVSGLRGSTVYEEPLSKNKTYIFTPNHFSYFDIISVNSQMPFFFSFMAKKELANIPLFRIFFRTIDMPVDRYSKGGAMKAYYLANKKLKDGFSIVNFPEGGIGPTVPRMRKFKLGPFKLAIECGVEIVPITIADNWKRLPSGGLTKGGTPGKMRMYVHRPIPTENLKSSDARRLAEEVYTIIEDKFNELNNL